jgi:integrase
MPRPTKAGEPARPARKKKLTELDVRNAKREPRAYFIWDSFQRGLALRVQPTRTKSWHCVYRFHGARRDYYIGNAGSIGLAVARDVAIDVMSKVAKGKDPVAERRAEKGAGTFAELAANYVERYAKKNNKSWQQADFLVRRYLLPRWGKLQASAIARADVRTMMTKIEAPVLANQVLASASAIFSWAVKQDIILLNPCTGVERNKTTSRERILSESEIPKFWAAFDSAGMVRSMALKAILLSGQRPGEVAHMRREHIKDGWWEMPGERLPKIGWPGTKNAQEHRVWLPPPVRAIIEELSEGVDATEGYVFPGARRGAVDGLDKAMRDICSDLKVERATPHDLRRTHGSTITGLGFGRDAMNRIQNHKEGGIASVYDRHEYADENKRVMESVAVKIMALAEGRGESNVVPLRG